MDFILLSVIKKYLQSTLSPVAAVINRNIFVDNLVAGCDKPTEAMDYYKEANCLLNNAGLRLQACGSNKIQLTKKAENEGVDDNSPLTKVLGLSWKPATDSLQVPSTRLNVYCHSKSTKRDILRGISGVYDPLGFIMPLTIPARILIQDSWKLKLDWDDLLPLDLIERWSGITKAIKGASVSFPHCYF